MYIEEGKALDALIEQHGPGSVSRRDPGEQGPLVFKAQNGAVFVIDEAQVEQVQEASDG